MRNIRVYLLLFFILLIGFFLRIYRISSVPPSLSNDEISIAYDAYSLVNIGRDSTGAFLPLSFRSHGTYKAPLYAYVAGPFIKVLGNSEAAVRLPSVIFGTLTILGVYFLIKKLRMGEMTALFSAFLFAITPWHIYTSRIALESNLALFFLVFGAAIFLEGLEKGKFFYVSSVFFALSLYSYHTEWIFAPLAAIFLLFLYKGSINKKKIAYWWTFFLALILPLVVNVFVGQGGTRADTEFILKDFVLQNQLSGVQNIFSRLFILFSFWLEKYLSYVSLGYIFTKGLDVSASYGISDFGLLNLFQLPLALLGILYASKTIKEKSTLFIIFWTLTAPLISSLTEGEPNLVRNLISVVPLTILCGWGFIWLWKKWRNKYVAGVILGVLVLNFAFFYRYYITQFPYHFAEKWAYGFKQIALYVGQNDAKYKNIIIDPRFGVVNNSFIGVPGLYILYFNKVDPRTFLAAKSEGSGLLAFLNYTIRDVDWPAEKIDKNTLYVVSAISTPLERDKMKKVYSIYLPDGTEAFKFYQSE